MWNNLFKLINKDIKLKTFLYYVFIFTSIIYFLIFGNISSFNIGSGQRFKVNFVPQAILFPLIVENKIRSILISRNK